MSDGIDPDWMREIEGIERSVDAHVATGAKSVTIGVSYLREIFAELRRLDRVVRSRGAKRPR